MSCCFTAWWRRRRQDPPQAEVACHALPDDICFSSDGSSAYSSGLDVREAAPLNPVSALRVERTPVSGLVIEGLLGVGTTGRVYKAAWGGVPCAAKVVDITIKKGQEGILQSEPVLTTKLEHPNIVAMYNVSGMALPGMPDPLPVPADVGAAGQPYSLAASAGWHDVLRTSANSNGPADKPRYLDEQRGSDTPPSRELMEELGMRRQASEPLTLPPPAPRLESAMAGVGSFPVGTEEHEEGDEAGTPVPIRLSGSPLPVGMYEVWMLSEFCDRGSLVDYMLSRRLVRRRDGSQNVSVIYQLLIDVARGLEYLHSQGIVHGDLRAGNVLLQGCSTEGGERGYTVKVGDFGLQPLLDATHAHAHLRKAEKVRHLAPEIITRGELSRASDAWAFGILMHEVWSCQRVFGGQSAGAVFSAVTRSDFALPLPADSPQRYSNLIRICLEREPANRPTFTMIYRDLRAQLKEIGQCSERQGLGSLELEEYLAAAPRMGSAKSSKSLDLPL